MTEMRGRGPVQSSRVEGDALVATLAGDVDLHNAPEVRSTLLALVARQPVKKLVLNLGQVPYMDSSAIAVLVELMRKVGRGGKVVLVNLQPRVKGLLEIARLDSIFPIVASEQEALGA